MQDSDGYTSLMFAAENGRELVVKLLLQHGAEISLQRRDGGTARAPPT